MGAGSNTLIYGGYTDTIQDTGYTFDSTTKFYICSDIEKATPFSCIVPNFRVWHEPTWSKTQVYTEGLARKTFTLLA